ncbi:uncharacterized protein LOC129315595 isoform X2 [Prosopis cineraria]|uniref:uncharacterized protein LOC129315595 isoform X2 n=1 Tax=Prosopis cineraria TaxID=364024 RepID=UPI00240F9447|nr:uncharacterized protein LOC129315595 isoform X2 [Prosopis cineraria]
MIPEEEMWVFYMISLPLTLGMVFFTLRYFSGPHVPRYVLFTVGYAWFCSLSIIILVPADIWETISSHHENGSISFFWSWSYWSTFLLTWAVVPLIEGFEDAGDFTVSERLKTSLYVNLVFYLLLGAVGLVGLVFLIMMHKTWSGNLMGFAMACSNTFGLVTGAFLLGFGLSEIPKSIWRNANWTTRLKVLSHKIGKITVKLDDAYQELSNAIVVAQATSNQMSKRDPLRPYMDVIDNFIIQMFREDPSFKPQGDRLAENDMDYDADEKSMATLRRRLRLAQEGYYRYKSEYLTYVWEALELEDTIKNYGRHNLTGWKYISSIRPARPGNLGSFFDSLEYFWRCILRTHVERGLAASLGILSVAILLAEATLLPSVDLSLFSFLIKSVGTEEVFVQVFSFVPLMYMCICTYYSLFRIGRLMFYSMTPRQTSSVSLLIICSMVARYAPPVSYNFLNLISLGSDKATVFEQKMGNINNAVPFFGDRFNKIYPLIMVIYTLLVASNFFNRVFDFLGSWKRYVFGTEAEDTDGFNPTGLLILQKERFLLKHGPQVGEQVVPLTRNYDIESGNSLMERNGVEMRLAPNILEEVDRNPSRTRKDETRKYSLNKEAISNKYATVREKYGQAFRLRLEDNNIASTTVPLLDADNTYSVNTSRVSSSGLASSWQTMTSGFRSFKADITNT